MLLRPKTGLKDMVAELNPGTPAAGQLEDGGVIPVSQTLPDVNLDEILASLDGDTRQYLQLLLAGGAEGLHGEGAQPVDALRRFEPTARDLAKVNDALAQRRTNIKRRDPQLLAGRRRARVQGRRQSPTSSRAPTPSSRRWPTRTPACGRSCRSCRRRCGDEQALAKVDAMARELGPTLQALRPGARALGPSLRETRPFLRQTTPIIRDEIRPFVRAARPAVKDLRPAARDLAA